MCAGVDCALRFAADLRVVNMVNALFSFAVFLCAAGQQLEDEYAREKLQPLKVQAVGLSLSASRCP